jgi:hypothetical protein
MRESKEIFTRISMDFNISATKNQNETADFQFSTTRNEHETAKCNISQNIAINRITTTTAYT